MAKVIDNFKVGKYLIIVLDNIEKDFTKIEIEGTLYDATIAYDIPNAISIESDNDFLEVDLQTREVISYTLPVGYEWCENHITHAKNYLVDINKSNSKIPTEKLIMWY